ncbi:MAG TPA: type I 3-dehydroquinate dehydratase, partial [Methanocorpusculum sp.]|nr:type I 3-dehydroquinate dehydratase [Methanocorpusculum sp.]
MTKICAVVTSQNSVKTALAAGAEALEYRFDMFGEIPSELYFEKNAVCIAALRNCDDKEDFFRKAIESGADFVDIEHDSEILGRFPKSKVICSYHDFEKTPSSEKIAEIFDELRKHGMPKAAFNVCSAADLMSIYNASVKLRAGKEPFILIGMGEC